MAGNVGLLLGSTGAGLLGDRAGRRPVLICCVTVFGVFSLLSAFVDSPMQLAGVRLLTGLGLGGGIPLAIALVADLAPPTAQGRLVILMSAGIPIGFTLGGTLAGRIGPTLGKDKYCPECRRRLAFLKFVAAARELHST